MNFGRFFCTKFEQKCPNYPGMRGGPTMSVIDSKQLEVFFNEN